MSDCFLTETGTGTSIGDPYELSAIGATFGKNRGEDNPIYVGSVKTNIGHLEGCAGLAGLIKATLVVERGQIPPLAGFEKANPRLRLKEWRIALPESLTPWPTSGTRRVSVNSFGYGILHPFVFWIINQILTSFQVVQMHMLLLMMLITICKSTVIYPSALFAFTLEISSSATSRF
jgi:hypothetical protein